MLRKQKGGAIAGEVNLDEEMPDMIERLVNYFYTLSYNDMEDPQSENRQPGDLVINASMYTLGDKYDIPPLKDLARERFMADLKTGWSHGHLLALVDVVYNTTPETDRGLRDCMEQMVREHGRELLKKEDFKDAVKSNGGFALDVASAAYGDPPVGNCSYAGCTKTDDNGIRFCQDHRNRVRII